MQVSLSPWSIESKNDISASIRIANCDNKKSKLINVVSKTSRTWPSGVPRFSFDELSNATYRVRPEELPDQSQMFKSMSEISAPQSIGLNITKETYPSWLKGTLLRNGPGLMEFGQERVGSLADSLPMIRRYHMEGQQASSSLVTSLIFYCLHFNNLLYPERKQISNLQCPCIAEVFWATEDAMSQSVKGVSLSKSSSTDQDNLDKVPGSRAGLDTI